MPSMTILIDSTIPVAEDFNGNFRRLNQAVGVNTTIANYARGDLVYASTTDTLVTRGIGSEGAVLTVVGSLPVWAGGSGGTPGGSAVAGTWSVRGLSGTLSTTALSVSALAVVLRNASSAIVAHEGVGPLVIDTTVSGLNGRDQASVFTASQTLHAYAISNGTTARGVWADSAPPTGPDLATLSAFSGYTYWAYLGSYLWNSASNFIPARQQGARVYYEQREQLVAAGTATTETVVATTSVVPALAGSAILESYLRCASTNSTAILRYITGKTFWTYEAQSTGFLQSSKTGEVPNVGQVFYQITPIAGTGTFTINVTGYTVPNGDA